MPDKNFKIEYTNNDFASLKEALLTKIPQLAPSWTNLNEGEMGMAILNMVAGVGDMLDFYINRSAEEMFLPLARSRESVKNIARLIDYRLSRPVAARTTLRFSVLAPLGYNITIPIYTEVKTKKDLYFTTQQAAILYAGQTHVDVDAFQGRIVTDLFTSTGGEKQTHTLSRPNAAQNFLSVKAGGVLWAEDSPEAGYLGQAVFEVQSDVNELSTLVFSRHLGSVPPQSSTVEAVYLETAGERGNIGSGLVTLLMSTFAGADQLTVVNTDNASGGRSRENADSARWRAPRSLRTMDRAVTIQDHIDILEMLGGVAKVNAVNHHGYVELYVAPEGGGRLYVASPYPVTRGAVNHAGSTLAAGTYHVSVTGHDAFGETTYWNYNPQDRTVLSNYGTVVVGSGQRLEATFAVPAGATGVSLYIGTTASTMRRAYVWPVEPAEWGQSKTLQWTTPAPNSAQPLAPEINTTGARSDDGSASLLNHATAHLEQRRLVGAVFAIFNPVYVPVSVSATARVYDNFHQNSVRIALDAAVQDFFSFENQRFGKPVTLSDLYRALMDVEGVRSLQFSAPADDVELSPGQLAVAGTVTLTMLGGVL
jgi:hypothetical protein